MVNGCWQAVFAKDDEGFDSVWSSMVKNVDGLGFQKVYQVDMDNTHSLFSARKAIEKQYADRK